MVSTDPEYPLSFDFTILAILFFQEPILMRHITTGIILIVLIDKEQLNDIHFLVYFPCPM